MGRIEKTPRALLPAERQRRWRATHLDAARRSNRESEQRRRERDRAGFNAYHRAYRDANRERRREVDRESHARRRAAVRERWVAGEGPATEGERRCATCGQTKPLTSFGVHVDGRDGRLAQCRDCSNARRRARAGRR